MQSDENLLSVSVVAVEANRSSAIIVFAPICINTTHPDQPAVIATQNRPAQMAAQ
jgi:hypothetical protein